MISKICLYVSRVVARSAVDIFHTIIDSRLQNTLPTIGKYLKVLAWSKNKEPVGAKSPIYQYTALAQNS
jgi:hypothetical protein